MIRDSVSDLGRGMNLGVSRGGELWAVVSNQGEKPRESGRRTREPLSSIA
jgi:hypothetical protein